MKHTFIIIGTLVMCSLATQLCTVRAERGVASYYHDKFHGRRMSNGERYNKDSFTCAHLRYPFGTWLRVSNPKNGKAVVVKVTDRGPHSKRFTIDLSRAAAEHLEIIRAGWARVEIVKVDSQKGGIVPFLMEEEEEIKEIELDFVPAAEKAEPEWQKNNGH